METADPISSPRSFGEFLDAFPDELACMKFIELLRWGPGGSGFKCSVCQGRKVYIKNVTGRRVWHCGTCGSETSVTAGTLFEDSRVPLRLFFHVIWVELALEKGLGPRAISQAFGPVRYNTAWGWLQKWRSFMALGLDQLGTRVEVGDFRLEGLKNGSARVMVAVEGEKGSEMSGRVRFRVVENVTPEAVMSFVADSVKENSLVVTDDREPYATARKEMKAYINTSCQSGHDTLDEALSVECNPPHVKRIFRETGKRLSKDYCDAVSVDHLQGWLDDFAFRFDERNPPQPGELFRRFMELAVTMRSKSNKDCYARRRPGS